MSKPSQHDAWRVSRNYDLYMGRWSRQVAPRFLDWLNPLDHLNWLEIGCGTGALSAAIMARCKPMSFIGVDPSMDFIDQARANVADANAQFRPGDAQALPTEDGSKDIVVSGLVLNFVPDKARALIEMKRVARRGGTVAFYVWDYPGGGMEVLHTFWTAATTLDVRVQELAEDQRFPFCTFADLSTLAKEASLHSVECVAVEIPTVFRDFEDYWHPFTLGAGPAPGYCKSLDLAARGRLKERVSENIPRNHDGSISLKARAWAVKGLVS